MASGVATTGQLVDQTTCQLSGARHAGFHGQNFSRNAPAIATKTWTDTYLPKLTSFLAFAFLCDSSRHSVCLELFCDQHLWLQYIAYLCTVRQPMRTSFQQHCNTATAALEYLQQQAVYSDPEAQLHLAHSSQLVLRVKNKKSPSLPLSKPRTVQLVQRELNAEREVGNLFVGIQRLRAEAQTAVQQEAQWLYPTAKKVHDAILLSMLFDSLPSPRESMLMTLQQPNIPGQDTATNSLPSLAPSAHLVASLCQPVPSRPQVCQPATSHTVSLQLVALLCICVCSKLCCVPTTSLSRDVAGVCTEQNCLREGCQGNRIFQGPDGRWYCVWPHHKSSRHRGAQGIGPVSLGPELDPLMNYYTVHGLKNLQDRYPEPDRRFMFVQKASGKVFESDSFNYYFRAELVPKLEAQGKPLNLQPHLLCVYPAPPKLSALHACPPLDW